MVIYYVELTMLLLVLVTQVSEGFTMLKVFSAETLSHHPKED